MTSMKRTGHNLQVALQTTLTKPTLCCHRFAKILQVSFEQHKEADDFSRSKSKLLRDMLSFKTGERGR